MQNDSFLRACRGERPERTPIWLMRQAGRYLPEYREVRARVSFEELCRTPSLCAEVTVQPIDRLGVDAAILFSDILVVFDALGVDVRFEPSPVIATPVRTEADLARLRWADPRDACSYVYEAVRACKAALADRVPLIGFCGAPFTTLSYLVEGKTSREFEHVKGLMFCQPGLFGQLMERLTDLLIAYLGGQVAAGADALQIFDSWAGALSPGDYAEYVLPYVQRVVATIKSSQKSVASSQNSSATFDDSSAVLTTDYRLPNTPVIYFGTDMSGMLGMLRHTGADVVGLDWRIALDDAWAQLGPGVAVQGNLDPHTLFGPWEAIERRAAAILDRAAGRPGHIFNLGHGILTETPVEHVARLADFVHEYSSH